MIIPVNSIKNYLLIIADATRASIYLVDFKNSELSNVTNLIHTASQEKGIDLVTDRPGHYKTNHSSRGAFQFRTDPKEHEKALFARQIAEYLTQSYNEGNFKKLVIIMPSQFWGQVEDSLSKTIEKTIVKIIQKDYTQYHEKDIKNVLRKEKLLSQNHQASTPGL